MGRERENERERNIVSSGRPSRSSRSDRNSPPTPPERPLSRSRGDRSIVIDAAAAGGDVERGGERSSRDREGRDLFDDVDRSAARKRHNLSFPICKDFFRGRCPRSPLDCRYAHPPPSVTVEGETVTVCYDSLRDRCTRGFGCRYFHPPPHIRVSMQQAVGIYASPPTRYRSDEARHSNIPLPSSRFPPDVAPPGKTSTRPSIEICRDFVRGQCSRDADDCRYAHHTPASDGDYAIVCQDFLRGRCNRGGCRYFHPPKHLQSRVRDLPVAGSSAFDRGHYEPSTFDSYNPYAATSSYEQQSSKRMRMDDSGRHRQRSSPGPLYREDHAPPLYQAPPPAPSLPPPPPPPLLASSNASDQDKLPVCRYFLSDSCEKETACLYAHPDPHVQVIDNHVSLCRDYLRGRCSRELCHYYHPPKKYASSSDENGAPGRREENYVSSETENMYHSSASPEVNGKTP